MKFAQQTLLLVLVTRRFVFLCIAKRITDHGVNSNDCYCIGQWQLYHTTEVFIMSNFSDMDNVFIMDHPLIQHKISILRNKETGTNEFRKLIEEIAVLMGFEALRDLPLEDVEVETPIETCRTPMISGKKLAVVPVLRAGLGMVNGITTLVPSAKIGHIGLYRDPVTHEPHEYYCKLPDPIDQRLIVMVDPMLATGGSAISAVNFIKQHGGKSIKCMFVIAAPEGLKRLHEVHPDVQIYVGHLDRELNDRAYICPGLGDAGDRIFGTK
jgi:uracil phosphoribosyltransferase